MNLSIQALSFLCSATVLAVLALVGMRPAKTFSAFPLWLARRRSWPEASAFALVTGCNWFLLAAVSCAWIAALGPELGIPWFLSLVMLSGGGAVMLMPLKPAIVQGLLGFSALATVSSSLWMLGAA